MSAAAKRTGEGIDIQWILILGLLPLWLSIPYGMYFQKDIHNQLFAIFTGVGLSVYSSITVAAALYAHKWAPTRKPAAAVATAAVVGALAIAQILDERTLTDEERRAGYEQQDRTSAAVQSEAFEQVRLAIERSEAPRMLGRDLVYRPIGTLEGYESFLVTSPKFSNRSLVAAVTGYGKNRKVHCLVPLNYKLTNLSDCRLVERPSWWVGHSMDAPILELE